MSASDRPQDPSTVPGGDWPTARYLATDLTQAVTASTDELGATVADRLGGDFDQAPVKDPSGAWVGFVLATELRENTQTPVGELMHPIEQAIVDQETAISKLLPILSEQGFLFTEAAGPIGFITPSDLSRQAGRAAFFVRIAALEIALADLLRRSRDREEQRLLLRHLTRQNRRNAECSYLMAREDDVEVDYVAYMTFTDLLDAVGGEDDLRISLGFESRSAWERTVGGLADLRNDVVHATREFVSPERGMTSLLKRWEVLAQLQAAVAATAESLTTTDGSPA